MAKKPKAATSELITALDFVATATRLDSDYGKHVQFTQGYVVAFDGVVAAGYRCSDSLPVAPRLEPFRAAVQRVGSPYSITVLDNAALAVKGTRLRVSVPCVDPGSLPGSAPDTPAAILAPDFIASMQHVGTICKEKADRVFEASVLAEGRRVTATNGKSILTAYHGGELPAGRFQIPKEFLIALMKIKNEPTHIGFSQNTFTIWFGPNAWMRTQLFDDNFPDCQKVIDAMFATVAAPIAVHQDLLLAVETLKPFVIANKLWLWPGYIGTADNDSGALYQLDHGLPQGTVAFDGLRTAAIHANLLGHGKTGWIWQGASMQGAFTDIVG